MFAAQGHLSFVHTELFPVLVDAVFLLLRRPRVRFAMLAGVTLGVIAYTDGYLALMGGVTYVSLILGALLITFMLRWHLAMRQRIRQAAIGLGIAGLLVLPQILYVKLATGQTAASLVRSTGDLNLY